MKKTILFAIMLSFHFKMETMAQSKPEAAILILSNTIFKWEVENRIDSLESIFDERFVVVGGDGNSKNKSDYIAVLKSGNFSHDSITVTENTATVVNNTATVIGKGKFTVTISGKKSPTYFLTWKYLQGLMKAMRLTKQRPKVQRRTVVPFPAKALQRLLWTLSKHPKNSRTKILVLTRQIHNICQTGVGTVFDWKIQL